MDRRESEVNPIKQYGKLKERKETKYIKVTQYALNDTNPEVILRNSQKAGYLFFPHHYLITADGQVNKYRPEEAVAFGEVANYETTISVLSDITEEAQASLKVVLNALQEHYKGVEIVEWDTRRAKRVPVHDGQEA